MDQTGPDWTKLDQSGPEVCVLCTSTWELAEESRDGSEVLPVESRVVLEVGQEAHVHVRGPVQAFEQATV